MFPSFVIIGIAARFVGGFAYVRDTLRGKTKPNRSSWLLWSLGPFIAAAASWSTGGAWVVLSILATGMVPFIVFIVSFSNKKAYWKLTAFDYIFGALALTGLVLWVIISDPFIAILFAIVGDIFATMPTIVKAWHHPETETGFNYFMALMNGVFGLFAVRHWILAEYGFMVYLIMVNFVIIFVLYRKRFVG